MKEVLIYQDIQMNKMVQKYKHNSDIITYLLTPDSYIEIVKKGGMKQSILSNSLSYKVDFYYNNQPIFVNESTYNSKFIQYIPFDHNVYNIHRTTFKLHPTSKVEFIEDICDNQIKKYYFKIYGDENNYMIREDILSFLSMLK